MKLNNKIDPITKKQSKDDSETSKDSVANEAGGGKSKKSQNIDSSQESGISQELDGSSESDGSQKSKDPCDVHGDELQALLPNKVHGFNAGFCRTGVKPCKITCRGMYGLDYIAAICRAIRGSGCRRKICLCVTKNQNKDNADLAEEGDSTQEHNYGSKPKTKAHSGGSKSMSESNSDSSKSKSTANKDDSKSKSKSKSENTKSKSKSKSGISKSKSKSKSENTKSKSKSIRDNSKSKSTSMSDNSKPKSKSKSESTNSMSKSRSENAKSKSDSSKSKSDNSNSKSKSKSKTSNLKSQSQSLESGSITKPTPSASCFSQDTMITTRNGFVRMDQLTEGTEVLVQRQMGLVAVFEPIAWFIHRDPFKVANFIEIIDDQGHNVTLSPNHLIPISDCRDTTNQHDEIMFKHSIFAKYAKVDMCIFISDKNAVIKQTKIVRIRNSVRTGIYSPISVSGSLIVNEGVLVSCYSQFQNQLLQRTAFSMLNKFVGLFDTISASGPKIDIALFMQYLNYVVAQISL